MGVFWVCEVFFKLKLSFFKYKAGQSHIIDVAMASSQSWRSHQLVLAWRRAERDTTPSLQQDVNIWLFLFVKHVEQREQFEGEVSGPCWFLAC